MSLKHGKITPITIVALCVGFLLGMFLLPVMTLWCFMSGFELSGGIAPDADFETRRAWGERTYGHYLEYIDPWIAKSPFIQSDVGTVQRIAPIGRPNTYQPGFTDGGFARMRLEVVGANGSGILTLPYVEIWNTGKLHSIGDDANWDFSGNSDLIHKSGLSYLDLHGLDPIYTELSRLAKDQHHDEYVKKWAELQRCLADTTLPPAGVLRGKQPPLISQLHARYREPLLEFYGDAQAGQSNQEVAVDAYQLTAKSILRRADALFEQEIQDDTRDSRIGSDLRIANRVLRKAHALDAKSRKILDLAEKRVVLQYLFSIGGRPSPPYSQDPRVIEQWAQHTLGVFHDEAIEYPSRSSFLDRTLGRWSLQVDEGARSRLYINNDNVFASYVNLRLRGRKKEGLLSVRIKENAKRCQPIDLFADEVRAPEYPITIVSPYWRTDGEAEVKLSAKTGEPL